jgi:hypothetical protein
MSADIIISFGRKNENGTAIGLYLLALSFALSASSNGLEEDRTFTTIDFPGATEAEALGINSRGDIVGNYTQLAGTSYFPVKK